MNISNSTAQHINLSLPKHWNLCSRKQLELIADVMGEQIERQDRYHPFLMETVKIAMFFALADLQIVAYPDVRQPIDEQYYLCYQSKDGKPYKPKKKVKIEDDERLFPLYIWQIKYWLDSKAKTDNKNSAEYIAQGAGILDWLDNKNGMYLTTLPYDFIERKRKWYRRVKTFQGPRQDLDGFSWAQYRFASDMMGTYIQLSNSLIKMKERGTFSEEQMMQQAQNVDKAKAMFLAIIFNGVTQYVDSNTGMVKYDYHYELDQCTKNACYFQNFPDTQWQVILFWWTGTMHVLSKRFPHVFKVQPTKKQKPSTPLEIYTATTATMQKYAGLTEDQVNNQSYSLVLEHLERLSKENEEMEKMRRK